MRAAAAIGAAAVEGAELGSSTLTFAPAAVTPGDYSFALGSAGSAMLVLSSPSTSSAKGVTSSAGT